MVTVCIAMHQLLQKCAVLLIFLHCTYMKGSSAGADVGLTPILNNGFVFFFCGASLRVVLLAPRAQGNAIWSQLWFYGSGLPSLGKCQGCFK